jgi:SAM-dependent methyltransferase
MQNTHTGKAVSYGLGRPEYPAAFYDYLYGEFGLGRDAVIADIGAGPGKVTQGFLERGSRVWAVEPDEDMRRILRERLHPFANCIVLGNTAEDTGIPTGAADLIFCGNSYHWFDRARAVPEFRRILRARAGANVVLAQLNGQPSHSEELIQVLEAYETPRERPHNTAPPFREGAFAGKEFAFTVYRGYAALLHGVLSYSRSPRPEDACFEAFCQCVQQHFERYSRDGKLETKFKLTCMIGNVNDLMP